MVSAKDKDYKKSRGAYPTSDAGLISIFFAGGHFDQ
jgi:hypothetical protein